MVSLESISFAHLASFAQQMSAGANGNSPASARIGILPFN